MDRRESNHRWYSRFNESNMTIVVYEDDEAEFTIPARYEVCETCEGKGSHVNPSIDSHGISSEEFAEDPDFAESYFRGDYDVACNECGGRRVAAVPDWDALNEETKRKVEKAIEDYYQTEREYEAERRWGA